MKLDDLKQIYAPPVLPGTTTAANPIATMLAAQGEAMVRARYAMALHRPRNWDDVRVKLLNECRRPAFAQNKSAYYIKPIGTGVGGLGIRFVEVALRCMTNVLAETITMYDDAERRILRVSVTELEANETISKDLTVTKTVERSKPAEDGSYIAVRTNSQGRPTYTVAATDDDLLNKEGALISKAIRVLGLRIIPGDLQDEAEAIILEVRNNKAAEDPAAERKRLVDAFAAISVQPSMLEEYLDHDLAICSPAELVRLRGLYGAIRDGETTWASAMENESRADTQSPDPRRAKAKANKSKSGTAAKAVPPSTDSGGDTATLWLE